MKSAPRGKRTFVAEVSNISRFGFWVFLGTEELFVPFKEFPWFRSAQISAVMAVTRPSEDHLYWPSLDIDVSVESIRFPERFPLRSRSLPNNALQRAVRRAARR